MVAYAAAGAAPSSIEDSELAVLSMADVVVAPKGQVRALVAGGVAGAWAASDEAAQEVEVVELARSLALERAAVAEEAGGEPGGRFSE